MSRVIRKLIKPNIKVGEDEVLKDVIESLAIFYDPAIMAEYSERLLMNSDLSSVFNACLKTHNMKFFRAYSSMLHNKIIAYANADKKSTIRPEMCHATTSELIKNHNGMMFLKLRTQYDKFLNIYTRRNCDVDQVNYLADCLENLMSVIIHDVEAGVIYDNVNAYVTLMNSDHAEIVSEVENIINGDDTPCDECFNDDEQIERYNRLYNVFEGNIGVITRMVNHRYFPNDENIKSTEDLLESYVGKLRSSITRGMILAEDMLFHLKNGLTPMQNVIDKLDECNAHIGDATSIATVVPEKLKGELSECLRVIDKWLAEGVSKKLRWRSVVMDCGKFNRVHVIGNFESKITMDDIINGGRVAFVNEMICDYLKNILKTLPSVVEPMSVESKLDILKVITDALDTKVTIRVKILLQSLYTNDEWGININETEDAYLRAWTTELYKALQDVTVEMTDEGLDLETYYRLKNYKNTNEN